jgi:hypothetical protein
MKPAVIVSRDVDVVVPGSAVAVEEVLHPLLAGRPAGRVLLGDEGDAQASRPAGESASP